MKKNKLVYDYHDSSIRNIEIENERLIFDIRLVPQWNNGIHTTFLIFESVKNIEDVKDKFAIKKNANKKQVAFAVIAIIKIGRQEYSIHVSELGDVQIDCKNAYET